MGQVGGSTGTDLGFRAQRGLIDMQSVVDVRAVAPGSPANRASLTGTYGEDLAKQWHAHLIYLKRSYRPLVAASYGRGLNLLRMMARSTDTELSPPVAHLWNASSPAARRNGTNTGLMKSPRSRRSTSQGRALTDCAKSFTSMSRMAFLSPCSMVNLQTGVNLRPADTARLGKVAQLEASGLIGLHAKGLFAGFSLGRVVDNACGENYKSFRPRIGAWEG